MRCPFKIIEETDKTVYAKEIKRIEFGECDKFDCTAYLFDLGSPYCARFKAPGEHE